jgi:taste receptor type 2
MKWRLHKVLLIIVLVAMLSFCIFLIFVEKLTNNLMQEWVTMEKNLTFNIMMNLYDYLTYHILPNMILIMFFVMSLTSFLLLIFSLLRHTRQMKLQGMYSKNSSREAHVRAMKTIVSFLVLYIMHYFGKIMLKVTYSNQDSIVARIFAHVLIFLYLSGHPFLLILWNRKLKQASLCVLRKLKCVRE